MRFWIQPWRTRTVRDHQEHLGLKFVHTANKELGKVDPGDWLCVYNFWNKHYLFRPIGAMIVASRGEKDPPAADPRRADFSNTEAKRILGKSVWKDEHDPQLTRHLFAKEGTVTRFDLWTPEREQLEHIEFADGRRPAERNGHIYLQTYSHVREVTERTGEVAPPAAHLGLERPVGANSQPRLRRGEAPARVRPTVY